METFPPNSILFGQYLLDQKKITKEQLEKAMIIQGKEDTSAMRQSHRLLGQILLEDFDVFKNRVELNRHLTKFNEYKAEIEKMLFEAKTYGKRENK